MRAARAALLNQPLDPVEHPPQAELALGFRPQADVLAWLGAIGILLAFVLALSWLSAAIGLLSQALPRPAPLSDPIRYADARRQRLRAAGSG